MATQTLTSGNDQQVIQGDTYKLTVLAGDSRVRILIQNPGAVKLRAFIQPGGTGQEYAVEFDHDTQTTTKRSLLIGPVEENDIVHIKPTVAPETATADCYINATSMTA